MAEQILQDDQANKAKSLSNTTSYLPATSVDTSASIMSGQYMVSTAMSNTAMSSD